MTRAIDRDATASAIRRLLAPQLPALAIAFKVPLADLTAAAARYSERAATTGDYRVLTALQPLSDARRASAEAVRDVLRNMVRGIAAQEVIWTAREECGRRSLDAIARTAIVGNICGLYPELRLSTVQIEATAERLAFGARIFRDELFGLGHSITDASAVAALTLGVLCDDLRERAKRHCQSLQGKRQLLGRTIAE